MDHVRELQGRLFAVAIAFVVFAAASYPFFDVIANIILSPLGDNHELVYLTPGGAFGFIIQVCMYVGLILALPVIIYNIYRFIMPIMSQTKLRTVLLYTFASFFLAITGILFAYFVSLPAALYFLTGFDLHHINPMLTIDSYFSFIMTYVLVGALLFQIPLIMLIINGATPLKPAKLMKHQGKIILGSFIVAAIVSPTPDAMNQALLASPMIVMYQVGIALVWLSNRRRKAVVAPVRVVKQSTPAATSVPMSVRPAQTTLVVNTTTNNIPKPVSRPVATTQTVRPRSVDGFVAMRSQSRRPLPHLKRPTGTSVERQLQISRLHTGRQSVRSLDGFVIG